MIQMIPTKIKNAAKSQLPILYFVIFFIVIQIVVVSYYLATYLTKSFGFISIPLFIIWLAVLGFTLQKVRWLEKSALWFMLALLFPFVIGTVFILIDKGHIMSTIPIVTLLQIVQFFLYWKIVRILKTTVV